MRLAKLLFAASSLLMALPAVAQPATPPADPVARTVEAIAGIRAAFSPSFSPDGRSLAFVSNAGGSPQIWSLRLEEGAAPVQLTRLADPAQPVYWSPAGDWLA